MAKKINKSNKKPKLVRSSSIDKTINEGRDYVQRADRRLRARATNKRERIAPNRKAAKVTKTKKVNKPTAPRTAIPPAPAVIFSFFAQSSVPPTNPPIVPASSGPIRTASKNLSRSGSKNKNIIIQQELQDRLGRHGANIGKLNFSLRWWDPNDLDLHVICPCGTQICFMNKKCQKCGGELDIDMNVGMNMSLQPIEHVYFNNPKSGLYKFFVQYYTGPKQFSGVKGTQKSKYALSLHEDMTQIFRYEDLVSTTQRQMHYDFNR